MKIVLILFLLLSCAQSENSENIVKEVQAKATQEKHQDNLKKKADEAYTFCKGNSYNTDFCILIDMKIHSGKNRMFVWDFKKDSISLQALCAHGMGKGSTQEIPVFSNENGSYCTSLGKYKLGIRSYSKWGINVHYKMHGLEKTNNNAYKRIVVLHSYTPVSDAKIYPEHLPLGWSLGCPVTSNEMMASLDKLLKKQKKPTLLWIYY